MTQSINPLESLKAKTESLPFIIQTILGVLSLVYATGYLVWAIYAYTFHLGFLPLVREQYIVAGIIPFFSFAWVVWLVVKMDGIDLGIYFLKNRLIVSGIIILYMLFVAVYLFSELKLTDLRTKDISPYSKLLILSTPIGVIMYGMLMSKVSFKQSKELVKMAKLLSRLFAVFCFILWMWVYSVGILYFIPSEFGGASNTCYTFDIDKTKFSNITISYMSPNGLKTGINENIIRTAPLYLVLDGGDFLILKNKADITSQDNPAFRLKKEGITGMFLCDNNR